MREGGGEPHTSSVCLITHPMMSLPKGHVYISYIPTLASPLTDHQVTSECFCAVGPLEGSQQPPRVLILRTFKQKCMWSFALHTYQKFKILATLLVLPRPYNRSCKKNIPVPQKLFLCTVSRLGKRFQEARIHLRMCLSLWQVST